MTCVWDAVCARLVDGERLRVFGVERRSPRGLVAWLQRVAGPTPGVTVNGMAVTPQQQAENTARVRAIRNIEDGYDCSAFDPVLILLAYTLRWHLRHLYAGSVIEYASSRPLRAVTLHSTRSHAY